MGVAVRGKGFAGQKIEPQIGYGQRGFPGLDLDRQGGDARVVQVQEGGFPPPRQIALCADGDQLFRNQLFRDQRHRAALQLRAPGRQ